MQQTNTNANVSFLTSLVSDWKKTASLCPHFPQCAFWLRGNVGSSLTADGTVCNTLPTSFFNTFLYINCPWEYSVYRHRRHAYNNFFSDRLSYTQYKSAEVESIWCGEFKWIISLIIIHECPNTYKYNKYLRGYNICHGVSVDFVTYLGIQHGWIMWTKSH